MTQYLTKIYYDKNKCFKYKLFQNAYKNPL